MITANFSAYNAYVTDSLHQWELNQVLKVTGLNITTAPEVHFQNSALGKAIVRQATLTDGVVKVDIPNSLLQYPLMIRAFVGIYEGSTFKVIEQIAIPVIPRERPEDYQIQDSDGEIYSFNALKNAIANKADTKMVNARIDNIIAHNNDTEGNTELLDMRTDIDGKIHASAGTAVRKWIHNLRVVHNTYYKVAELLPGSIVSASDTYRFHVLLNPAVKSIKIIAPDIYQYGIQGYDADNYGNKVYDGGWLQNDQEIFDLNDSLFYNIEFKKVDESQKMTDDDRASIIVLQSVDMTNVLSTLQSQTLTLEKNVELRNELYNTYYQGVELLDGSINGASNYYRYHALFARNTKHIKLILSDDYTIGLQGYDNDNYTNRVYDSGWKTGSCDFYNLDPSLYYNVEIRKTDETEAMTANDRDNITVLQCQILTDVIDNLIKESNLRNYSYYNSNHDFVKSIAHRGYSVEAPENTAPAFIMAKKKGFSYVETDIQVTADGRYVCVHDETCTKYTNGVLNGKVSDYTLAELQAQDWGAWKDNKWIGTKILTFEEFVALCKALSLNMYIEFKFEHSESDIAYYVNYVKKLGMLSRTSWLSNQYSDIVRQYDPEARVSMTGGVVPDDNTLEIYKSKYLTNDNSFFLDLDVSCVTEELSDKLTNLNIPLEVWTVNDLETMKNLLSWNIQGITTDSLIVGSEMFNYYM